jgi:hypothetical protein
VISGSWQATGMVDASAAEYGAARDQVTVARGRFRISHIDQPSSVLVAVVACVGGAQEQRLCPWSRDQLLSTRVTVAVRVL